MVGLGVYRLPVTIGFNLRLDWQLAEPIELDDLRIYFRFNLNTIWFGTEQGIAPRFQHK